MGTPTPTADREASQALGGVEVVVAVARVEPLGAAVVRQQQCVAVFSHEEEQQTVDETEQLAVVRGPIETSVAQCGMKRAVAGLREEPATKRFDCPLDARPKFAECS